MEDFRHNLTPVEVKKFLKISAELTENLFIRFCFKIPAPCPRCRAYTLCHAGAVSFYSSNMDKLTHEIQTCLSCGYKAVSMVLTIESL